MSLSSSLRFLWFSCRGKAKTDSERYEKDGSLVEIDNFRRGTSTDSNGAPEASSSAAGLNAETVILSLKERVQWLEQRLVEKVTLSKLFINSILIMRMNLVLHIRGHKYIFNFWNFCLCLDLCICLLQ